MLAISCTSESKISTEELILKPGFQIELVAAEPLLESPVAMDFDNDGNIWVVEMTGYMRDIDGSDENKADGKIVKLSDSNHNGRMDKREIMVDGLIAPRALALVYGGLLYTDDTKLLWADLNDLTQITVVDSLYINGGNIEHQPNGLLYNIDNWIYSAKSTFRYRLQNREWKKEATSFRGQWGIAADEMGRLFYNDNANLIRGENLLPNQLIDNPYQDLDYSVGRLLTWDNSVYPFQPTAVNRGYQEGVLDSNQLLTETTSACSPFIYKGNNFPEEYNGSAFVCIPEINAIKRLTIEEDKGRLAANHVYRDSEFLVSQDETFRPVNLYDGPDGAIYIVDLRKGIIQHRAYMTHYLREKILSKGLDQVTGKGRIYKLSIDGNSSDKSVAWKDLTTHELVSYLKHKNGYLRMKAQKELVFRNDESVLPSIETLAADDANPIGQIHALWTLEGLSKLTSEIITGVGMKSENPQVLMHILRLANLLDEKEFDLWPVVEHSLQIDDENLRLQLSHTLGKINSRPAEKAWVQLADQYRNDTIFSEALLSGISGRDKSFMSKYFSSGRKDTITRMLQQIINYKEADLVQVPTLENIVSKDVRTSGFNLYNKYCSSCHMMDGKGQQNLAPPLVNSFLLNEPPEKLALLILQGLQGPVTAGGRTYEWNLMMPGLKVNNDLSDQDIADLAHFVRNAFVAKWTSLDSTAVKDLRGMVEGRDALFTEVELEELCM